MANIPNPVAILCVDGELITVPDKLPVPSGTQVITWIPSNVDVESIVFDDPAAPFTSPQEDPTTGRWTSTDQNDNSGPDPQPWKYTVTGTCPGGTRQELDPEIVNDPPPGDDLDLGKGKGKGKGEGEG